MLSTCLVHLLLLKVMSQREEMHPLLSLQMRKPRVEMAKQFFRGCMGAGVGIQSLVSDPKFRAVCFSPVPK